MDYLRLLKENPHSDLNQVAVKTGVELDKLRDAQLEMLRRHLKRDSKLWALNAYGR